MTSLSFRRVVMRHALLFRMRPPVWAGPRPRPVKRNACATTRGNDLAIVTSDCRSTRLRRHLAARSLCTNVMVCTRRAAQFVIGDAHFVGVESCAEMERFAACATGACDQYGPIREASNRDFVRAPAGIAGRSAARHHSTAADEFR